MTRRERNLIAVQQLRLRRRMRAAERRQAVERDAQPWPLLDAFRKAADKRAVIRASLETWRRE